MFISKKMILFVSMIAVAGSLCGSDQGGMWNRFSSWFGSYFAPRPRYNYLDARTQFANRLYKYGLGTQYKPAAVAQELVNEGYANMYVPKVEIEEGTPNIARYPYINTLKRRFFMPVTMKGVRTSEPTPIQGIPVSELVKVENEAATVPLSAFDAAVVDTKNKMEKDMLVRAAQQVERNRENMHKVRRSIDEGYLDAGAQLQECLIERPDSCGLQAAEFNDYTHLKQDTNRRFNAIERQNYQVGQGIERRLRAVRQAEENRKWQDWLYKQEVGE